MTPQSIVEAIQTAPVTVTCDAGTLNITIDLPDETEGIILNEAHHIDVLRKTTPTYRLIAAEAEKIRDAIGAFPCYEWAARAFHGYVELRQRDGDTVFTIGDHTIGASGDDSHLAEHVRVLDRHPGLLDLYYPKHTP